MSMPEIVAVLPRDPKALLRPEFLTALRAGQESWFTRAMAENDVFAWTPQAPVRFYYGRGDQDSPMEDTRFTVEHMHSRGGEVSSVDVGDLDHNSVALAALPLVRAWFDSVAAQLALGRLNAVTEADFFDRGHMYDEAALKAVLQRAMELDASNATAVTTEEVVHIATELGISESAVREALREREWLSPSVVLQAPPRQTSALRILALSGGAGVFAGVLTSGVVNPVLGMAMVGAGLLPALIMVSGGLALTDRSRSLLSYVRRNTAVWLGFGIGWTVWSQVFPSQSPGGIGSVRMAVVRTATVFVLTTVAGLAFLVVKRTIGASRPEGGSTSPISRGFRSIALRVKNAIQDVLGTRMNRASATRETTIQAIGPVVVTGALRLSS